MLIFTVRVSLIQSHGTATPLALDIYLKKKPDGSTRTIEEWNRNIPECSSEDRDAGSPSSSILLATAEEDLEKRVALALSNLPDTARILMWKLKEDLPFILPLFCDEDETSIFEDFHSYAGYERGTPRKPASNSTFSTSGSKSTSSASITTPATTADSGKDGFGEEEEDDDSPNRKRPRKGPKDTTAQHPGDLDRRRLRCHFHAKCPKTHCQKTCIMNGWLNIHNLRFAQRFPHILIITIAWVTFLIISGVIMGLITLLYGARSASKSLRKSLQRIITSYLVLSMHLLQASR